MCNQYWNPILHNSEIEYEIRLLYGRFQLVCALQSIYERIKLIYATRYPDIRIQLLLADQLSHGKITKGNISIMQYTLCNGTKFYISRASLKSHNSTS